MHAVERLRDKVATQNQVADELGIARTTLAYWAQRECKMSAVLNSEVVAFFESPPGLVFLHQIVTAAMYTFHKDASCGLPTIQRFFKLGGIDQFVASSIGCLHKVSNEMDHVIIKFGAEERARLAQNMPQKNITAGVDV